MSSYNHSYLSIARRHPMEDLSCLCISVSFLQSNMELHSKIPYACSYAYTFQILDNLSGHSTCPSSINSQLLDPFEKLLQSLLHAPFSPDNKNLLRSHYRTQPTHFLLKHNKESSVLSNSRLLIWYAQRHKEKSIEKHLLQTRFLV